MASLCSLLTVPVASSLPVINILLRLFSKIPALHIFLRSNKLSFTHIKETIKCKANSVTDRGGPFVYERPRLPHF
jgi:hypothetical protein